MMGKYSDRLAEFAASATYDQLPADVARTTRLTIMDTLGCIAYGARTEPGRRVGGMVQEVSAAGGGATVFGHGTAPSPMAAVANGTMAHSFELDDRNTESMFHASASVLPAALAVGQEVGGDGKKLMLAMAIGHEVASRVSNSVNPDAYVFGWHSQGWHPTLGAAAAAGVMLDLTPEQLQHALGLAATQASGLIEVAFSSDGKPFHAGKAAMGGVVAARLAKRGYTGGLNALEGSDRAKGFCYLLSPEPKMEAIVDTLGTEYKIHSRNGLKPYSCAGDMHPGIDALLEMMPKHEIGPEDIESIEIYSFRIVPTHFDIPHPKATIEGLMSYQHSLAVTVLYGKCTPAQFSDEMLDDPVVDAMREKIHLHLDEELDKLFPEFYTARTELVTNKGNFEQTVLHTKGDPENPMSEEEIEAKFSDLLEQSPLKANGKKLLEQLRELEELADVRELAIN
jgi:2-methylcitrate dehydratase PrpD